jgi:hypothetical protein
LPYWQLNKATSLHPPGNENRQPDDGKRYQHPVLDGNTAQDYALLDKPIHEASHPQESYLETISSSFG